MAVCEYDVASTRPLGRAASVLSEYRVAVGSEYARRARVYINWFERMDSGFFRDPGCLELVIVRSSGYDHVDVDAAAEAGVCVANQPEVIAVAVAEYAVAGILAVARRIVEGHLYFAGGEWPRRGWPRHLRGFLVRGRTVGLLGAGRIGGAVAGMLHGLGARVAYYYSRSPKPALESYYGARRVSLEELFEKSEILVNSLPLTPETRGIVTLSLLRRLPRGAVYVNVGRGGTEEPGAVEALARERPDVGLVLDVHPVEPVPEGAPRMELAGRPLTVTTPHFAGYSLESMEGTTLLAAMQARDYLRRGCVWNPVGGPCRRCPWGAPGLGEVLAIARGTSTE